MALASAFEVPACGVLVAESRYAHGALQEGKSEQGRFYLVLAGRARWECAERNYVLGPNTLCHIPPAEACLQEALPNEALLAYVLRYRPSLLAPSLSSQLNALGVVSLDLMNVSSQQGRVVRSVFQEMLFEQEATKEGWETMLQSRLLDLAVRVVRLARRRTRHELPAFELGNESIERVTLYVQRLKSQFFRQETVSEASRSVGLSSRQFTHLFRKVTGQRWRQYVQNLRMKHAAELLIESDRSVSAVAFESGFEDLSNFHHCFKTAHGCAPLAYREQRRIHLPEHASAVATTVPPGQVSAGFRFRGIKGWSWTTDQYLEEIPTLVGLNMNFLMNCYRSMAVSEPGAAWCNEWWQPLTKKRQEAFSEIIRLCRKNKITFCFAMHPQLASPRPLDPANPADVDAFWRHYSWMQSQGVKWFSICLDDMSWGPSGPQVCGKTHARLVNSIFERLQAADADAQMIFCPAAFWGDGTNPEHNSYLAAMGRDLHPSVFVFWNGDAIVTPRITRIAAESYRRVVQHRLFLWDNYPVNDASPTLHLGALSGREADLCEVVEGYLSNPMCSQNQINRIPLSTAADYASNPKAYNPARSIVQAIRRLGNTAAAQQTLKDLVEAYPGFIVAGGGTGTNPVRTRFGSLLESGSSAAAQELLQRMEAISAQLDRLFPAHFPATKKTVLDDVRWMKQQFAGK